MILFTADSQYLQKLETATNLIAKTPNIPQYVKWKPYKLFLSGCHPQSSLFPLMWEHRSALGKKIAAPRLAGLHIPTNNMSSSIAPRYISFPTCVF